MVHVLVTPKRAAFLRERVRKLLAERFAGKEAVERIVAGAPRSSFGKFARSFEEIEGGLRAFKAERDEQRDRGRLPVEPHAHDGSIENEPYDLGSAASDRAFQGSQSPFALRQARLTTSLPTAPSKMKLNGRRARRVLVSER
jgi:hypothetical protein